MDTKLQNMEPERRVFNVTIFVFILEMLVSAEECEGVSVASPVQKREARQHTNVCRAQGEEVWAGYRVR